MKLNCFVIFHLLSTALCLTQDQIFQNDWQSVNIGIPIDTIESDNKIITFTDIGVFAILNSISGDVLYRYQSEILPISSKINSGLVESSSNTTTNQILNFINFDNSNSKLLLWSISNHHGVIEKEYNFPYNIIDVKSNDDFIYIISDQNILFIDLRDN